MTRSLITLLAGVALLPSIASAQSGSPLSVRSGFPAGRLVTPKARGFRLGDAGVMCTAQVRSTDARLSGIFYRAYQLTCRDAAAPIGSMLAVRRSVDLANERSALKSGALSCRAEETATIDKLGPVRAMTCRDEAAKVDYKRYAIDRGKTHYWVEGLAGYDPALRLALASLVTDRQQSGAVQVATTEVSDPASFARIQAGTLDAAGVRTEAYSRNNGGRFAESAEFFENLVARDSNDPSALGEALANQGLQQSNLGNFAAAERLLAKAAATSPSNDGVLQRLTRNYRAINLLNQRKLDAAISVLDASMPTVAEETEAEQIRNGLITPPLSNAINRESVSGQEVAALASNLTPGERATILDAQAVELAGVALREQGRLDEAAAKLGSAQAQIIAVRDGRVQSARWLLSEIGIQRALIAEARGDRGGAAGAFDAAIAALDDNFPQSPALLAAKARKAGYMVRTGDTAGGRALFQEIVTEANAANDSSTSLRGLLGPYFDLLGREGNADAAAAMFLASQTLQRPGVAQTQAILARQYSGGSDEGSAMFRLAVARTREILREEGEIRRLEALESRTTAQEQVLAASKASVEALRADQVRLQAQLGNYPRYKVLTPDTVPLGTLQAALRPGEGYYKLTLVGDAAYAIFASHDTARVWRLDTAASAMANNVTALRGSIVKIENGEAVTEPFDLVRARAMYVTLFGPVDNEVRGLNRVVLDLTSKPPGTIEWE